MLHLTEMPFLAICVVGSVLVYFASGFLLTHYTKADVLGIRKASLVFSFGFALFGLTMFCESALPGKLGQWTEGGLILLICAGSLALAARILIKS